MQTLLDELTETLQDDERLVIEGKLAKNKIVELALKLDKDLLKLLLSNDRLKEYFFEAVGGTYVFDKHAFQRFISNKQFLPDSYTAFKNKIGLTDDGENYFVEKNDVTLIWPYKDCVLEGGQTKEDTKRNEIFWNETLAPDQIDRLLAPKALTSFKKFDKEGEQEIETLSLNDNYVIKGNNLLALHSLKKVFRGKIKLIYIDPPYNTGNDDFGYNDRFNHSAWMTFMKNRLEVARELLAKDGTLWVNIDEYENGYLRVLLDEVFGRENYIADIIWQKAFSPVNLKKTISISHDTIYLFAKDINSVKLNGLPRSEEANDRYSNPDNDPRGPWTSGDLSVGPAIEEKIYPIETPSGRTVYPTEGRCWVVTKERFEELRDDNRIWFGKDGDNVPRFKRFLSEVKDEITPMSLWLRDDVGDNQEAKREVKKLQLSELFGTPKPERLMQRIIHIGSNEGDLILDFFAGSGTTGAVAHKMNRQYILCEQMDYVEPVTIKRLQKVIEGEQGGISEDVDWEGGGSFVYGELTQYNATFIKEIEKADSKDSLQEIWEQMQENAFLSYKVDPSDINKEKDSFDELTLDEQKQFLIEVLDKNQLYVNYSDIEDEEFEISEDAIQINHKFYNLK